MNEGKPRLRLATRPGHGGLIRGSAWVFFTRILVVLLGLVVTVVVARWYGIEATGFVALINSSALVFGTFAVLGQGTYLIRELASHGSASEQVRKRHLYLRSLSLVAVASLIFAGPVALTFRRGFPDPVWTSSLLAIGIVVAALVARTFVVLTVNTTRAIASAQVFCVLLLMPVVINLIILVIWGSVANTSALVPSAALATGLFVTGLAAVSYSLFRLRGGTSTLTATPPTAANVENTLPSIPGQLKAGLPFLIANGSSVLLTEGNIVLAGFFLPASDIGVYSVAHRIAFLAGFALQSISMIAQPEMARKRLGVPSKLRSYARQVSDLIFWSSVPLIALLFFARHWLVDMAFGPDFERASSLLVVLLAGQAVVALTGATNPYLTMTGGQNVLAKITLASACLSVVLTMVLTPHFGLWGPAMATSAALTVLNVTVLVAIRLRDGFWLCWLPRFLRSENSP